jgi:hypothetical protein
VKEALEISVPDVGKVRLVAPVAVRVVVYAPLVARVEPSAKVKVADDAGAVIATLLTEVAVATPIVGVTRVGLVARTAEPEPVTAEIEVPLILNELPVPAVSKVLFVKVSVVARPTMVSVDVGSVSVPVLRIVPIVGLVRVLLVRV